MRIELYGDQLGAVSLIDVMGNDIRACHSARVSFLRDQPEEETMSERDQRLIRFLIKEGHTSPFEHSVITFKLVVPLFVRAQIMRHRTFSFNEVSRRYTSDQIEFYVPSVLRKQSTSNLQCSDGVLSDQEDALTSIKEHALDSLKLYEQLLESGVAREQARIVLPQSMYTTFWMTGNLHNYIKFLRLRASEHAQQEARDVAYAMQEILLQHFPITMEMVSL